VAVTSKCAEEAAIKKKVWFCSTWSVILLYLSFGSVDFQKEQEGMEREIQIANCSRKVSSTACE
jgi:hypothetical protein